MPNGKRGDLLEHGLEQKVLPLFDERILPFDLTSTSAYDRLLAKSRTGGQPIAMADAYIAAIAITHQLAVATRDTAPFKSAGLMTINPWRDDRRA